MKQIQIWMGHSNYSTTADVYSHLESTAQLESANCIERVLSRPEPEDE
ncbi:recombinase [Christensenellaceae bacterium OttesenSCG-928-K19]|nr:recombinase [Christensenellaceae bacterium OttesenSCG-928-K19]